MTQTVSKIDHTLQISWFRAPFYPAKEILLVTFWADTFGFIFK